MSKIQIKLISLINFLSTHQTKLHDWRKCEICKNTIEEINELSAEAIKEIDNFNKPKTGITSVAFGGIDI